MWDFSYNLIEPYAFSMDDIFNFQLSMRMALFRAAAKYKHSYTDKLILVGHKVTNWGLVCAKHKTRGNRGPSTNTRDREFVMFHNTLSGPAKPTLITDSDCPAVVIME